MCSLRNRVGPLQGPVQTAASRLQQDPRPLHRALPVLRQERELMELAEACRWPFRILGVAPVPEQPVFYKDAWLVPIAQDTSRIPDRALERVQAIYAAGIRPKTFIIGHEARALLPAPADAPKVSPLEFWSQRLAENSMTAAKVAGVVLAGVVIPLSLAAVGVGVVVALGLVGAAAAVAAVDPCLIVVTEDDVWILIDRWDA